MDVGVADTRVRDLHERPPGARLPGLRDVGEYEFLIALQNEGFHGVTMFRHTITEEQC
jgi:hypothetical protein